MITSEVSISVSDVAGHYDELDEYYRRLWGDHLHHGLWKSGRESIQLAVEQLIEAVASPLELQPGQQVCDIGCGYGGTSRYLAEKYDVSVTGFTVSEVQFQYAQANSAGMSTEYQLQNWEENALPDDSMDGAVSIECLAHIVNKQEYFKQLRRVLKPGAKASITAWLSSQKPSRWSERNLLEPICSEGRLPSMGDVDDYRRMIEDSGLKVVSYQNLSRAVRRTWRICGQRVITKLLTDAEARRFLTTGSKHAVFAKTVLRILVAYYTGAMHYGLFTLEKPLS